MYSFTIGTSTSIESIWYYRLLEDSGQELWLKKNNAVYKQQTYGFK